jgi:hypothetical protein
MKQTYISAMTCIISLLCAVITSIELYLGIQKTMENELIASKDFYLLAVDLYKMASLPPEDRMVNARTYLDDKYKHYCKLMENSDLIDAVLIRDQLTTIHFTPDTQRSTSSDTNSLASALHIITHLPSTPSTSTSTSL